LLNRLAMENRRRKGCPVLVLRAKSCGESGSK
jgi:hypothetical protein